MTSFKLKFAVISAVALLSAPSFAAWETLPVAGFAVTGTGAGTHQPTGGTTPYRICNPNGNYGSKAVIPDSPVCKSPIAVTNINTAPEAGFTLLRSGSRTITMNNALTNNTNVTIGTLQDRVFRNAATNQCIFGTQVTLSAATDHFAAASMPGNLTFEINGIARGGFASAGTVSVSYAKTVAAAETLFRAGRTLQTVQHRAVAAVDSNTFAPGYYNLPVTSTSSLPSVVGDASTVLHVPTILQQSANLDANWVEFTTDANYNDPDDGPQASKPITPAVYVKTACTAAQIPTATAVNDAIRLRMAWQEQGALVQAFVEVRVPAFVPVGGNALPAVVPGSTF